MFDIKYGKIKRAIPVDNGTAAFCFFPYKKNPKPIDPNTIAQIRCDVSSI